MRTLTHVASAVAVAVAALLLAGCQSAGAISDGQPGGVAEYETPQAIVAEFEKTSDACEHPTDASTYWEKEPGTAALLCENRGDLNCSYMFAVFVSSEYRNAYIGRLAGGFRDAVAGERWVASSCDMAEYADALEGEVVVEGVGAP